MIFSIPMHAPQWSSIHLFILVRVQSDKVRHPTPIPVSAGRMMTRWAMSSRMRLRGKMGDACVCPASPAILIRAAVVCLYSTCRQTVDKQGRGGCCFRTLCCTTNKESQVDMRDSLYRRMSAPRDNTKRNRIFIAKPRMSSAKAVHGLG